MKFIETDGGVLVNLTHVKRITQRSGGERGDQTIYSLYGIKGELLGDARYLDTDALVSTIIPAAPEAFAWLVSIEVSGDRPTDQDVYTTKVPIVGWNIGPQEPQPILLEHPGLGETTLLPMPDGRVYDQYNWAHKNFDEAIKALLRAAQDRWDDNRRVSEVTTP